MKANITFGRKMKKAGVPVIDFTLMTDKPKAKKASQKKKEAN